MFYEIPLLQKSIPSDMIYIWKRTVFEIMPTTKKDESREQSADSSKAGPDLADARP